MANLQDFLIRGAQTGDFEAIEAFLAESEFLYPGIDKWWTNHVVPGIGCGSRKVVVVSSGDSIEGLFIGKVGNFAKVCTLRLRESARNQGIGRALVTEGLSQLLGNTVNRFHVTISEAAEQGAVPFFESLGFRRIDIKANRYRQGVDEFIYACPGNEVQEVVRNDLTKGLDRTLFGTIPVRMPSEQTLLMSLKPEFAQAILHGTKSVEFRRKFSAKYQGAKIVFYISSPVKRILFSATIQEVDHRPTEDLWQNYKQAGGISREIFDQYYAGTSHGYAIVLSAVEPVPRQLELDKARRFCPEFRPPQSFQSLPPESNLLRALEMPINL